MLRKKNLMIIIIFFILLLFFACPQVSTNDGTKQSFEEFNITFDRNTGNAIGTMTDQTVSEGNSVNLNLNAFVRGGFDFNRWNTSPDGSGTDYSDGANFTMGGADVTLYAQWVWKTYSLRNTGPSGGLIFYINPNASTDGWKYLEAAPSDQSSGTKWSNVIAAIGTTNTGIGTGNANSLAIVGQTGHTSSAAQLCLNLSVTGGGIIYDDWFLPSLDELDLMYDNLHAHSTGGFSNVVYASSSEQDTLSFHGQNFNTGAQPKFCSKGDSFYVRAARSF